jgi:hypothetical protein
LILRSVATTRLSGSLIPVLPIPVLPIPVLPIPVLPIPVLPIPVLPIPVLPIPAGRVGIPAGRVAGTLGIQADDPASGAFEAADLVSG